MANDGKGSKTYLPRSWRHNSGRKRQNTNNVSQTGREPGADALPSECVPQTADTVEQEYNNLANCSESNFETSLEMLEIREIEDQSGTCYGLPPVSGLSGLDGLPACVMGRQEQAANVVTVRITGIRFGYACKIYYFDASDMDLNYGEWVIVKTEKGLGLGQVALPPFEKQIEVTQAETLRRIVRKGTKVDLDQKERCCQRESEAHIYCLDKIEELCLPMKLVSVECFFDCSKYVFYFTSEGRVDFRELVKLLVSRFPVRIEMRQIGVRHEAKMTGGIACCGQELCCSRFLTDFRPVSVKMAKNQNLSLNPTKISGVCGRLMCCLSYEHDIYEDFSKGLPKVGKLVATTKGEGCIIKHNPLEETVMIKLGDDTIIDVRPEDILGALDLEAPKKTGASGSSVAKASKKGQSKKQQCHLPCKEN